MIDTVINKKRPAEILLVEDNQGDVLLTQKAFKNSKIANHITVAIDGEEAINILKRNATFEGAYSPDIILLDLNLPKKSGQEVLMEIKSDPNLKSIPVIIMTSSRAEMDVVKSYNLHANGYVIKPLNLQQFSEVVGSLEQFWFTIVVLPDRQQQDAA